MAASSPHCEGLSHIFAQSSRSHDTPSSWSASRSATASGARAVDLTQKQRRSLSNCTMVKIQNESARNVDLSNYLIIDQSFEGKGFGSAESKRLARRVNRALNQRGDRQKSTLPASARLRHRLAGAGHRHRGPDMKKAGQTWPAFPLDSARPTGNRRIGAAKRRLSYSGGQRVELCSTRPTMNASMKS